MFQIAPGVCFDACMAERKNQNSVGAKIAVILSDDCNDGALVILGATLMQ
jgi:hypothetical protein